MITIMASAMKVSGLTKQPAYTNGKVAWTLTVSSVRPRKENGVCLKYYMRVEPDMVTKIMALKIRNGSIVDIVATESNYQGKDGKLYYGWEVKDISISDDISSYREREENHKDIGASDIDRQTKVMEQIFLNMNTSMFSE